MYLSRSQRRMLLGGGAAGLAAALLVPAIAQIHAAKQAGSPAKIAAAPAAPKRIKVSDLIHKLELRIAAKQALAAKLPHKSGKEAEEEFHEQTHERIERFLDSHKEKADKSKTVLAAAEEDEDAEGPAGTHAEQALLYQLITRYSPDDVIDPEAFLRATQHRDAMRSATSLVVAPNGQAKAGNNSTTPNPGAAGVQAVIVNPPPLPDPVPDPNARWQLLGPKNGISSQYAGRVNAVLYDVRNPGRVFCGGAKGGIWKSTDYGNTWAPKSDYKTGLAISSIAIDPSNSNTLYAGTGDFDAGSEFYAVFDTPFGMLKSTDGGETWNSTADGTPTGTPISGLPGSEPIHKILVDPVTPTTLYATCGANGLYKSFDSGATWTQKVINFGDFDDSGNPILDANGNQVRRNDPGRVSNIVFNSTHTELLVCTDAYFDRGGVYSSTNGGNNWNLVLGVSKKPLKSTGRFDIATSLSTFSNIQFFGQPGQYDPGTAYVIDGGAKQIYKRLYQVVDTTNNIYGLLWNQLSAPSGANWGQAFYDIYIATGALDRVFVGLVDFHYSLDGGATWVTGNAGHSDQHAISIVNLNQYILGNDGGTWLGTIVPNGTTSTSTAQTLNRNLYLTQFYFGAYNPGNPNGFLGGSQDNSSPYSNNGSAWPQVPTGDGGGSVINQDKPGTQYTSSYNPKTFNPASPSIFPVYRTDDAWNSTFQDISVNVLDDNIPFLATIKSNLADTNLIYLGTNFLWQYNAKTNAWTQLPQQFTNQRFQFVLSIGSSPQNKNVLYTGTTDGLVYVSMDGGRTFNNITSNLRRAPVSSLFVSPTNPLKVYATIQGGGAQHVFVCNNALTPTWTSISGTGASALPATFTNSLAIVPNTNERSIYVGTDIGVFYTADGGATWSNATQPLGLPNAEVRDVTVVPGTGYLMASTFGRSVWRLPVNIALGTVTFAPILQSYRGDKSKLRITVSSGAGSFSGYLSQAGTFPIRIRVGSTYNFYVTIDGFLKKRISGQYISSDTTLVGNTPSDYFVNGDTNNDNVIDNTDATNVRSNLNRRITTRTDVDGDGIVTSNDYLIVQGNLNKFGD